MQMKAYNEVSFKKQNYTNRSYSDVGSIDTASILEQSNNSEEESEMHFSEAGEDEEVMTVEEEAEVK